MALTITQEGYGILANADSITADTSPSGGIWVASLNGLGVTTDTFLYGTSSISHALSNKSTSLQYDVSGNTAAQELDFSGGGTEEGQHVYFWIHCPTIGLLETKALKGLAIRIGTSLTDYREWLIAGSDDANAWNGGWKCFILDPTKTGSVTDTGTYDLSSLRYFGVWMETTATAKGDNIFLDQISVSSGLRVLGTSTTGWLEVVDYCTDYPNRAFGQFQEREGIYYGYGTTWIGDAANQAANVSFTDSGRVIQFGISEYWDGTSAWVTSADIDYSGIVIEDHASYTTTFTDGVLVSPDNGRSGSSIIGNLNHNVSMDLYGGNHVDSVTALYGTSLKSIYGPINSGNDINHLFYGVSISDSDQFDPVGAPVIRNCTFAETTATIASLLWNENIDVEDCSFIANATGAGIEMPSAVGTPYTYTSLTFSGNTFDANNTSGSPITISNVGSNGSTSTGSAVTFQTSVTLTVGGVRSASDVWIYKADDKTLLASADPVSVTDGAPVDGVQFYKLEYTYNAADLDGTATEVKVFNLSYINVRINYILTSSSARIGIQQTIDRNYYNP